MPEPGDPWTDAWEEAVASVPQDIVLMECLELINPAFIDPVIGYTSIRVVNAVTNKNLKHEAGALMYAGQTVEYIACPFEFQSPAFAEGQAPEATVTIDNLGGEVAPYLEAAEQLISSITVVFRVYRSDDPTTVVYGPLTFVMRECSEASGSIQGSITLDNPQNLRFLRKVYSKEEYTGLVKSS
jgi:hypothetical protein